MNLVWQHPSAFSRRAVVSYWRKYVHEVLVNPLGGLSLPRKSVVRLTDRPDMTLDVYRGRKTTIQQSGMATDHFHIQNLHENTCHASLYEQKITLKCLSIGTPNTTTFPFVPNGKWWLLGVPIFKHITFWL